MPRVEFGFTAHLGLNIRIKAKSAGLKIEYQWSTKSGFLGFHFTGKSFHHQCQVFGGLYNLYVHILPAQASLKEGIVSSLQDGLLMAWLVILAFICVLDPVHITSNFQSLASTSYHGWVVMETGIVTVTFSFSFHPPASSLAEVDNQCWNQIVLFIQIFLWKCFSLFSWIKAAIPIICSAEHSYQKSQP